MTEKELAKYVLTHNLNEVIEICKKIINTEEKNENKIILTDFISIKDIPDISRKMLYFLQEHHYENVSNLIDNNHIETYGRWWNVKGIGKESVLPIIIYFYKNNIIKDKNTINQSFLEYYQYCIHFYFKKKLITEPKKIEPDLTEEERLMTLNIRDSKLSKRAKTVLIRNNINTIGELLKVPKYELRKMPQLGWCTYNDIIAGLIKYGLAIKEY